MFEIGKKKADKAAWAAAVLALPVEHPEQIPDEKLRLATEHLLVQHERIVAESIDIIRKTKYEDTRQGRIDLCRRHYDRLQKLKPFADKKQLARIRECEKTMKTIGVP